MKVNEQIKGADMIMRNTGGGCIYMAAVNLFTSVYKHTTLPTEAVKLILEGVSLQQFDLVTIWNIYETLFPVLGLQMTQIVVQSWAEWEDLDKYKAYSFYGIVRKSNSTKIDLPEADGVLLLLVSTKEVGKAHILSTTQVYEEGSVDFVNIGGKKELEMFINDGYEIFCAIGVDRLES